VRGAEVVAEGNDGGFEVKQYPWPSQDGLVAAILEADRALAVGAMEYVPDEEVHGALKQDSVIPLAPGCGSTRPCLGRPCPRA
jgi:hypothetical protein